MTTFDDWFKYFEKMGFFLLLDAAEYDLVIIRGTIVSVFLVSQLELLLMNFRSIAVISVQVKPRPRTLSNYNTSMLYVQYIKDLYIDRYTIPM